MIMGGHRIVTARKRSGEGYVFTPVCDSVNRGRVSSRGEWGVSAPGGGCLLPGRVSAPQVGSAPGGCLLPGGCPLLGGVCSWGGVCSGGVCSWGVSALGGSAPGGVFFGHTVNARAVCILLECILVNKIKSLQYGIF